MNTLNLMQSKSVSMAVYNSNWVISSYAERRSLSLMLMIAEKGSSISLHSLCILNLQTFAWVSIFTNKLDYSLKDIIHCLTGGKIFVRCSKLIINQATAS